VLVRLAGEGGAIARGLSPKVVCCSGTGPVPGMCWIRDAESGTGLRKV